MSEKKNAYPTNIAGIQLALFEVIWPTFEWIDSIYLKSGENACVICVQSEVRPSDEEWNGCRRLINEILDIAFCEKVIQQRIFWQQNKPEGSDYIEIMTPAIFEEIAREVDPSRLDVGR